MTYFKLKEFNKTAEAGNLLSELLPFSPVAGHSRFSDLFLQNVLFKEVQVEVLYFT
jgi:hypothetical protein